MSNGCVVTIEKDKKNVKMINKKQAHGKSLYKHVSNVRTPSENMHGVRIPDFVTQKEKKVTDSKFRSTSTKH
jgi:hypothetical protein